MLLRTLFLVGLLLAPLSASATSLIGFGFIGQDAPFSRAADVSADGTVVVGTSSSDRLLPPAQFAQPVEEVGFVWTLANGLTELHAEGNHYTTPLAISPDGSTVVGSKWEPNFAGVRDDFSYDVATQTFGSGGSPPGAAWDPNDRAWAVSAGGSTIVGGASNEATFEAIHPYIWDPVNGSRWILEPMLDEFGFPLNTGEARGISADGSTVVGNGWRYDVATDTAPTDRVPRSWAGGSTPSDRMRPS